MINASISLLLTASRQLQLILAAFKNIFDAMRCRLNLEVVGKALCIILLILQGAILDYYLVEHHEVRSLGFIATDIIVVAIWIGVMFMAKRKFLSKLRKRRRAKEKVDGKHRPAEVEWDDGADEIAYVFIAWLAYVAITLVPEVAVIFKRFADQLGDAKLFGQNILKVALCITPMLFLLLVNSHHDGKPNPKRKIYIDKLSAGVTLDLLDSIDILEILFMDDMEINLPIGLENTIILFACINFFLPTLALLQLSAIVKGQVRSANFQFMYSISYIVLVNVPLGAIRIILWTKYNQDVSVFVGKNVIASAIYMFDIYATCGPERPAQCPKCDKHFAPDSIDGHKVECSKPVLSDDDVGTPMTFPLSDVQSSV